MTDVYSQQILHFLAFSSIALYVYFPGDLLVFLITFLPLSHILAAWS